MRWKVSVRMPGNAITAHTAGPFRTRLRRILVAAAILLAGHGARAASPAPDLEFVVSVTDRAQIATLRHMGVTLDHGVHPDSTGTILVPVIGDAHARARLHEAGFRTSPPRRHAEGPTPAGYRRPAQGDALLRELAGRAHRGALVELGRSVEARPILGLWLGQPPSSGAPTYRVLGAHHGDEWSSFEVALALAEHLVDADGQDADVTRWLDQATLWIVPYVNPDAIDRGRRYNANHVDLNRNYGFEWSEEEHASGTGPFSEPEVQAIRDTFFYDPPILGLSLHAGAANIGYVWNWTTQPAPDRDLLASLAWRYADLAGTPGFWVTNGAEWYVTRGDTNDWSYGSHGALDFTVELTVEKMPDPEAIPVFVAEHLTATLALLRTPPVRSGRISDEVTGQPLQARVRWLDHEGAPLSMWAATDPETGRFHGFGTEAAFLEVVADGWAPVIASTQDDVEIRLRRHSLGTGRVEPALALPGSTIHLPVPVSGPVQLTRSGSGDIAALASNGRVVVDGLSPGAWTVILPDGTTFPSAVLVSSVVDARATLQDDHLLVRGRGFREGTRAWALWGPVRAHVPLPVLAEGADEILLDLASTPSGAIVDVLVLTGGKHLAFADVHGLNDDPVRRDWLTGGSGCATPPLFPTHPSPWLGLGILAGAWRRRGRS